LIITKIDFKVRRILFGWQILKNGDSPGTRGLAHQEHTARLAKEKLHTHCGE